MKKNKLPEKRARLIKIKKHNLQQIKIKNEDAVDYHIVKEKRKRKDAFKLRVILCGLGAMGSAVIMGYFIFLTKFTIPNIFLHLGFMFLYIVFYLQALEDVKNYTLHLRESEIIFKAKKA